LRDHVSWDYSELPVIRPELHSWNFLPYLPRIFGDGSAFNNKRGDKHNGELTMTDCWSFKMKILAIAFAWLLPAAIAQAAPNQEPDRIWITDVNIISPEKLDHIEKGSVLIDNGRIVRVERKKGAKKPTGATVVSGEGQFLIPGLIDSHVHLASIPGMRLEVNFGPPEAKPVWVKEYFKQLPRSYLYFGYTTLVDLAVLDRRVLDDFRHAPLHPDLHDCGESLPFANGYPMSFAPPESAIPTVSQFCLRS
jgi:hypothetical protein